MNKKNIHKLIVNVAAFAVIMALTFWSVFRNQNFSEIADSISQMSGEHLAEAVFLAVFFCDSRGMYDLVSAKGNRGADNVAPLYFIFVHRLFLFGYYAFCDRWTASAVILHEAGWK